MAITSLTHVLTVPQYATRPHLSPDGRWLVVWVEGATQFVGGNDYTDGLVVLDLTDGSVVPLQPPAGGGNEYPHFLGASWDTGQVFFEARNEEAVYTAYATNLVTGQTSIAPPLGTGAAGDPKLYAGVVSSNGRFTLADTEALPGAYFGTLKLRDRLTGETRSVDALNKTLNEGKPYAWGVSDDGRMVMFETYASNVIPGDTNERSDHFVHDMLTGRTVAVQSNTAGVIGDGYIFRSQLSDNGRYVAFESNATNLVPDGASTISAVYVKDLTTGAIVRVSEDAAGRPLDHATVHGISADGRYVTLSTYGDMGLEGGQRYGLNIYVKDMQTGGVGLVNRAAEVATSTVESVEISADGSMLVYMGVKMEDLPTLHPVFHTFVTPRPEFTTVAVDGRHVGSSGADTLAGALGNDTYEVNHGGDIVIEYAGQGADTVITSIDNYTLPDHVENLQLTGAARNATGNALDNLIRGTAGTNVLRGGDGNDILDGAGGADTLYGDAGFDIARFAGSVKDYTLNKTTWRHEVKSKDGSITALHDVEHLQFADADVTFDTDGIAAQAYRIYQAAFDRKPDLEGLGYWISRMSGGMALDQVARHFVDSLEFKTVFGANPDNVQLVDKMYQHVLHRAPDPAGRDYWIAAMEQDGLSRAQVLESFSQSQENQDALIVIIGHGIAYTPYVG
jgi:Ca2+-binding RTX toxin-like protein